MQINCPTEVDRFRYPLADNEAQNVAHAVSAGVGYVAMALSPYFGGRALRTGRAAVASYVVNAVSAVCLTASVVADDRSGLLQRAGLTVVDLWFAAAAVALLARRRS